MDKILKSLLLVALLLTPSFTSEVYAQVIPPSRGGLGTSVLPALGQIPVGNGSGGYNLTSTSSLGIGGAAASSSPTFGTITATTGTSSLANLSVTGTTRLGTLTGLLKAVSGYITTALVNLASEVTGILPVGNGGTGSSTPSGFLYGPGNGSIVSSSTISANFIDSSIARVSALSGYLTLSSWYATTTDGLREGTANQYFTQTRARSAFSNSATGLTYTPGTGALSLTSGYVIPLTASTSEWSLAYGWGNHAIQNYFDKDTDTTTNLTEGSKLFYTDVRVGSYISSSSTVPHISGTAFGDLLYWTGSGWGKTATSSLGLSNSSFSTTSADFWDATKSRWATTSDNYAFSQKTTANLAEGSNLYYTDARVLTYLNSLSKGYFFSTTSVDFWDTTKSRWATTSADYHLSTKSTSNLSEGSNLYYTDVRVGSYLTGSTTLAGFLNYWTKNGTALSYSGGISVTTSTSTNATSTNLAVTKLCLTGDTCRTTWPTGGGGTPGGANKQVQFNDSGAFAGDTGLTYNKASDFLTTGKLEVSGVATTSGLVINEGQPYLDVSGDLNVMYQYVDALGDVFFRLSGSDKGFNFQDQDGNNMLKIDGSDGEIEIPLKITQTGTGLSTFRGGISSPNSPTGSNNEFFGRGAGNTTLTGQYNTGLGSNNFVALTNGSYNLALGSGVLGANTSGERNVGIGAFALDNNTTGGANVALGQDVLGNNTTGSGNIGIGAYSMLTNILGSNNVAIGTSALENVTAGNNIAIGFEAGKNITSGAKNIYIGYQINALSPTASNTLNIANLLFATGLTSTGTTISSGNFGIGTTSPSSKLEVYGTTTISGPSATSTVTIGTIGSKAGCVAIVDQNKSTYTYLTTQSGVATFSTTPCN